MPIVDIQSIDGDSCSTDGQYIIYGTLNNKGDLESNYTGVEIRFSSPESSGLCYIEIENEEVTMTCQNKEKFTISQILIDRHIVQDSEGNEIFIVNSFTSPEQFACDISLNSVLTNVTTNVNSTEPIQSTDKTGRNFFSKKNNGDGLSGGAIAAIVICLVIAVAVVAALIVLAKKGILFGKPNTIKECDTSVETFGKSTNQI